MATTLSSPTLYRVCCNCNAPGADVKCSCLAVYHCGLACQQAHILEHKHECTHLLCKSIKKKGAVISRLQVQGSSAGVASVEPMVLEQELARVLGARGGRGRRHRAPTGLDQSNEDCSNRGVSWGVWPEGSVMPSHGFWPEGSVMSSLIATVQFSVQGCA